MRQDCIPTQGVLYLFGIKSLIHFSHSFQNNHYPITITITCCSTTTTTTIVVCTTIMLCRCRLTLLLVLHLLMQQTIYNWQELWAEAACCHQARITTTSLCWMVSALTFIWAASGSKSSRVNDGSHSSGPMVCSA